MSSLVERLGQHEITEARTRNVLGQLAEHLTPEEGIPRLYELTTTQPVKTVSAGKCRSITIVNFSDLDIFCGLLGSSATVENGMHLPPQSFITLPFKVEHPFDIAAPAIAAGTAQVVVISHPDPQPFNAGPLALIQGASIYKQVYANQVGVTPVWTPTPGKKFRILKIITVTLTANVSQAVAGLLLLKLQDGAIDLPFQWETWVPSVAGSSAGPGFNIATNVDLGNGYLSVAVGNVLNINLQASVQGGQVNVIVTGIEE